jgi:hypothetical protein
MPASGPEVMVWLGWAAGHVPVPAPARRHHHAQQRPQRPATGVRQRLVLVVGTSNDTELCRTASALYMSSRVADCATNRRL